MNVEIGIEAPIFLFWEYLFQIFGILSLQCTIGYPCLFLVRMFNRWTNGSMGNNLAQPQLKLIFLYRNCQISELTVASGTCNISSSNGKTSIVYYRTLSFFAFRFKKKRKFAFFRFFKYKITVEPVRFASISKFFNINMFASLRNNFFYYRACLLCFARVTV